MTQTSSSPTLQTSASQQKKRRALEMQSGAAKDTSEERLSGGAIRNLSGSEVEKDIYKIKELVEKPPKEKAPSNLAIMGRYVLTPDIFDKIDETEPGVGGEIQLTDALQKLDSIYGVTFRQRPMT